MQLTEVLNITSDYKWTVNNGNHKTAIFTVKGIDYAVHFQFYGTLDVEQGKRKSTAAGDVGVWFVAFNQPANNTDRMTGTGNEFAVISNVVSIVEDAIQTKGVQSIMFQAWQQEISKIRVYDRIVKRLISKFKWKLYDRSPLESKMEWIVGIPVQSE